MTGEPPLIAILGPTAVGKTGLAIELAEMINGEIVGADSRQVYRLMDIGTAKPTPQQRGRVPHHLIDLIDPDEVISLALYQAMAYAAIDAIHQRGHVPLLVGGTGQYLTAVVEGWSIPEVAPNYTLRTELETFATQEGPQALYARLQALDPIAAERIHPNNVRRVVRALEVCLETGQPISALQHRQPPPYRILQIGLTMAREQLYAQADQRVEQMIQEGFVGEVRHLLNLGYSPTLYAMSGLGYREIIRHLVGEWSLDEAIQATKSATHDFIRRQYTWFRGHDTGIRWYDVHQREAVLFDCRAWIEECE